MANNTEAKLDEVADAIEQGEPAVEQPDAVLVVVERKPNGDMTVNPQVIGDVRITELDTILARARKVIQARLGID